MRQIRVVSVGDTGEALIAQMEERGAEVLFVRRCAELTELLAACQNGIAQAAVIATPSPELTATLIDRLTAVGVCVIAVSATPAEHHRLESIGATALPTDASAELLTQTILAAVEARRHSPVTGFAAPAAAHPLLAHPLTPSAPAADGPEPRADQSAAPTQAPAPGTTPNASRRRWSLGRRAHARGKSRELPERPQTKARASELIAVWGPIGSPGRTTVAMNLAAEYATQGRTVLLIDADSYGASIAAALGLLDESASFAQACRAADQGALSAAALAKTTTDVVFAGGTFSLLTGLTRADRWPELRAAAVERVLKAAAELAELVVVDCGFSLENDEELSYDTIAPRRNAATLTALARANVIVAVGTADTIGIPRLIRGLAELARIEQQAHVRVVINKVRRKAVGGAPEKALEQAWQRFGPSVPISHFLPWDPDLTDKALLEGRLLMEVSADAALSRALRTLSCADDQQKATIAGAKSTAQSAVHG